MTYEYATTSNALTGRMLHFSKGTPIYQIDTEDIPIGGRPSLDSYYKTGRILNEEYTCPEVRGRIGTVIPYKDLGYLMYKDSVEAKKDRRQKIIISSIIPAVIIIGIIIYKRKHK